MNRDKAADLAELRELAGEIGRNAAIIDRLEWKRARIIAGDRRTVAQLEAVARRYQQRVATASADRARVLVAVYCEEEATRRRVAIGRVFETMYGLLFEPTVTVTTDRRC